VTRVCALPAGGNLLYWSSSFGGKDSPHSISFFSTIVFACLPSLSVRASTVAPAVATLVDGGEWKDLEVWTGTSNRED